MDRRLICIILATIFILSACSAMPGGRRPSSGMNAESEKYFTGNQGVVARMDGVPTKWYFYKDDPAGNHIEVPVEVVNEGASFTRGAVFLSGYDPNLITFDQVPIQPGALGACGFSIGTLGFGSWGGIFECDGFMLGGTTGGDFVFDINSMRDFVQRLGTAFGKSWWDADKFDFSLDATQNGAMTQFDLSFLDNNWDLEYMDHGRLLIALFSGVNFERTYGVEYMLAGDTYEYPGGQMDYIMFDGQINQAAWPPGLDTLRQSLMLTNCYFYTTYAAPLVCIDSDPVSDHQKVCYPQQHSWSNSQGAPVAITSIEQENTPREGIFRIQIQNVGHGEVFDAGKLEKCSPYYGDRLRSEDKNIVYVGDIRIGRQRLQDCTPNGIVRLQNGKGTISCKFPFTYDVKTAYETPLVVELWYGYSETQQRDITIKRMS